MKNIAIFIYDSSLMGGAEKISLQLANDFSGMHNVSVISLFQEKDKPIVELKPNVNHYVLCNETGSIPKNILKYSVQLKKLLSNNDIDIVLGITAGINSIAYLSTVFTKIKWYYCEHSNLENQTYGKLHFIRQMLGAYLADKIIVLTNRDEDNFKRKFKISKEKIKVIPNYFENKNNFTKYNEDTKKIISVGRLVSVKQFDHIIDISKDLFNRFYDWEWHIYGDGEQYAFLENKIVENNLQTNVKLMGMHKDVISKMEEYSFLVLTSKYEGLPMTLLEAQSSNLPVVAYDCPTGPADMIIHNENGILVKADDKALLLDEISSLIEKKEKRIYLAKNSKMLMSSFSKNRVLKLWENVL